MLPDLVGWIGVALMFVGIAGPVWAARTLGASYTRTLRTLEGQRLVRAGPYRFVRHPGYAWDIVMWLGRDSRRPTRSSWRAWRSSWSGRTAGGFGAEERMLLDTFGDEYREYSRRTWRSLPPLY